MGWRRTVVQGDFVVSNDANAVFTTVLGSCVAVCLHDPVARVGGMNHFLLASPPPGQSATATVLTAGRYGSESIPTLIRMLEKRGAQTDRMQARIYGGAETPGRQNQAGPANAAIARAELGRRGITVIDEKVGGQLARRIDFAPSTGVTRITISDRTEEAA
jgi:chemotaxis protein CheD